MPIRPYETWVVRSVVDPELSDVVNAPSHESNLLLREECAGLHNFLLRLPPCRMLGGCKESGSGDYNGDFHVKNQERGSWIMSLMFRQQFGRIALSVGNVDTNRACAPNPS
jgi:hypothetical protein